MYQFFNPNPYGRFVGDCAVRAVAKALDIDWDTAYVLMAAKGFVVGDMSNGNSVWGSVLKNHGFVRDVIPNTCPDCYTFEDFANDHPSGTFVLGTGTHVATVIDGVLYDAWDSSREIPQYVWRR